MPPQKPGKSKQDYETPNDLIVAIEGRFGKIAFDLAASESNKKAKDFFSEEQNSLVQDWSVLKGNLWLNPPFANIAPWAGKCLLTALCVNPDQRIMLLIPASVGSVWYSRFVHNQAYVLALDPRLKFVGAKDCYPKDCVLAVYGNGLRGFDTWRWKV